MSQKFHEFRQALHKIIISFSQSDFSGQQCIAPLNILFFFLDLILFFKQAILSGLLW